MTDGRSLTVRDTAGGPPGYVVVAGAVVLALAGSWFAVRNAVLQQYTSIAPEVAMRFLPVSGEAEGHVAVARVTAANGVLDDQSRAMMHDALRRAPLLGEPLMLGGLDASAANDESRARTLFREAMRRDPRNITARYWLFDDDMQGGNYAEGLSQVDSLTALQPLARGAILGYLTALIGVPQAHGALVAALRQMPDWRGAFFDQAAQSPSLRQQAEQLLVEAPNANPGAAAHEQQDFVMGRFLSGDFAGAYRLWLGLLPPAYRAQTADIYNGDFAAWPGGQPFNWRYPEQDSGIGLPGPSSDPAQAGLQIHFGGDTTHVVAVETILLPAGRYQLGFTATALDQDSQPEGPTAQAQAICTATGKTLGSDTLGHLAAQPATVAVPFAVPAGCAAVTVQFRVLPGIDPGTLDARIANVRIVRAAG